MYKLTKQKCKSDEVEETVVPAPAEDNAEDATEISEAVPAGAEVEASKEEVETEAEEEVVEEEAEEIPKLEEEVEDIYKQADEAKEEIPEEEIPESVEEVLATESDEKKSAIKLQNVSMTYDNINMALNDVSLDIKEGEFVFIVGANGAGKTTLTKLLICEERVSSGRLTINDFKLHKIRSWKVPKLRRTIGMVFQDFKLFDNMTVYENVAFAMRVVGAKSSLIRKRVPVFLEMVGVGHKSNAFPTELSGGEKQRVAFARAIVNNPDIVIADEPTGNIDTKMTEGVMELLLKINKLGKTVIVITHDAHIVQHYNKRVIKLENGQVVSDKIGGDF